MPWPEPPAVTLHRWCGPVEWAGSFPRAPVKRSVVVSELASLLPLVGIALLFWFLMIRPAQRRQREVRQMQSSLAVGDEVMLTSGIYGVLQSLDDERVSVQIAPGVVVEVARGAVGAKVPPATDSESTTAGRPTRSPRPRPRPRSAEMARRASPAAHPRRLLPRRRRDVRPGGAGRLLEARARPRPRGRHPHPADRHGRRRDLREPQGGRQHHRPARQRHGCRRGRGDHRGQPVRRRRDPRRSSRSDLVETVERQAQLRFRLVAQNGVGIAQPTAAPTAERIG